MPQPTAADQVQTVLLKGFRLADLPVPEPDYPYSLLLAQIRPEFAPGLPLKQAESKEYDDKIRAVLAEAVKEQVHFCVLPEYSLPVRLLPEIRDFLAGPQVPAGMVFLLPLEHLEGEGLWEVMAAMGVAGEDWPGYLAEFPLEARRDKVLNLCWVAAKGADGLISQVQAKLFEARAEEPPLLGEVRFAGGKNMRLFITSDDPPRGFAAVICFDFMVGEAGRDGPLHDLQKQAREARLPLHWLFAPQCNPAPLHYGFSHALKKFHQETLAAGLAVQVVWVNSAGGFGHNLANEGGFGGSALTGVFTSELPLYYLEDCPGQGGKLRKLTLFPETELLVLYRDKLLPEKISGRPGQGIGFVLEFRGIEGSRIFPLNPRDLPPEMGYLRSAIKLRQELSRFHDRQLTEHVQRELGGTVPYIDLKLEQGEFPEEREPDRAGERGRPPDYDPLSFHRRWRPFTQELWKIADKYLLIREVGGGKTTFLHRLAREVAARGVRLPVFLNLREIEARQATTYPALLRNFAGEHLAWLPTKDEGQALLQREYDRKRLVFLLDGLDQIAAAAGDPPAYDRLTGKMLQAAGDNALIITTRPSPAETIQRSRGLTFLKLKPLDRTGQELYFGAEYYPKARELAALAPDLAQSPILAYMLKYLLVKGEAPSQARRAALYEKFVNLILRVRPRPSREIKEVRRFLEALAFHSLGAAAPQQGWAGDRVFEEVQKEMNLAAITPETLPDFGLVHYLLERGPGSEEVLWFTHQSFQEFLAARYVLANAAAWERVVREEFWQERWREVLKFLAGLEESGRTLAALYADPAADNVIHSRLFLVAECAAEAPRLEVGWEEVVVGQIDALTKEGLFADDAIQALALLPSAQARERVGELLEANKAAVRRAAAKALETVGERLPREVIQRLAVRLEDDYEGVRWAAAKALRKLGQRLPGEVIKKLAARLEDDYEGVRGAAAEALGELGERLPGEVIKKLAARLEDDDKGVRWAAADALRKLGERLPEEVIHKLAPRLEDDDDQVRWAAAEALGNLGDRLPVEVIERLAGMLEDKDRSVRASAAFALGMPGERLPEEVIHKLAARLEDDDDQVRWAAAEALRLLAKVRREVWELKGPGADGSGTG